MKNRFLVLLGLIALLLGARAWAGPPLICHPADIGTAASLPWNASAGWNGMLTSYDVSHLVGDTLAVLHGTSAANVQMETLRRAAIYSSRDPRLADQLARR